MHDEIQRLLMDSLKKARAGEADADTNAEPDFITDEDGVIIE